MKRNLLFLIVLCAVVTVSLHAQTTVSKRGLVYELNSNGTACLVGTDARIIGGRAIDAEVRSGSKSYRVVSVRPRALAGQNFLTQLTIDANLDSIGIGAFRDCAMMTEVIVNGSVKYLGSYAFANTGIKSIDLSSWNPEKIGNGIVAECASLTEAHLPAGITVLPECTFGGCTSLVEPNLESLPLTKIEAHGLCDCSSITNLKLPDSVTSIGDDALAGMSALTELVLPQACIPHSLIYSILH